MPRGTDPKKKDAIIVLDDEDTASQEQHLADLRRRALAALNIGLPPSRDEVEKRPETQAGGRRSSRCTCLRRSGRCTCNEDRAWLVSKRQEVSMYQPPHMRKLSGGSSSSRPARLKKRNADSAEHSDVDKGESEGICKTDAAWLEKKRRLVVPYVPPHVKERDEDLLSDVSPDRVPTRAPDLDPEKVSVASSNMSVKRRKQEWASRLEQRGESRFNILQMDAQIEVEDADGLVAECTDHPLSAKGVKGLPAIQSGRYQFEVELLRDSSMIIGWSGAMTLPGVLDNQGYGYASSGCKVHGQNESSYAKPYGKTGDIVGTLIDWIEPETATGNSSIEISFYLNGESLGSAFKIEANFMDAKKEAPIPLQPHIIQLPKGDMLKVRLRGSKPGLPLAHRVEGFEPLSAVSDLDFCPFSAATSAAMSERLIMNLTADDLKSFRLPESHIVELYDFPSDSSAETLISSVACFLGLKRYVGVLHVDMTEAGSSIALAACRRPEHVERLLDASRNHDEFGIADCMGCEKQREKPVHFEARSLSSATAKTRQCLNQLRSKH